ncbi:MAG: sulfotransferase, partial [Actinomycetota bacterium]|nr:sulfotransferase [Actinomycetota bacterium]
MNLDRRDVTRFVILGAPRTGTNLLCTLLGSHPRILCHHEVFNVRDIIWSLDHRDGRIDLGTTSERDADPLGFLAKVWRLDLGHAAVGFKLTAGSTSPASIEPDLLAPAQPIARVLKHVVAERQVLKVVVKRRSRVSTYLSEKVANTLDQWEAYDARDLLPRPRVSLELAELAALVRRNDFFYEHVEGGLRSTGQRWLTLWYEDLLDPALHRGVLRFLGHPYRPLVPRAVKQNPV